MRLLLVVFGLALTSAEQYSPITRSYHEEIGIPEARRIKIAEESMDFDGARITGGQTSLLGNHPHMGGMLIDLTINVQSVCGSSLISRTRLVTAAHCWRHGNFHGRQVTVVLGSVRLFTGGIRQLTDQVTLHPNYRESDLHNDLAVIIIREVATNNAVNIIRIPSGNNNYAGAWATAAGFGRTEEGGQIGITQVLSHVNLQVITNQACARTFGNDVIISSTLCTATANSRSTCGGDSGGPLAIGSGTNRELIGIVSFNHREGCTRGHPAGFARVTSFAAWIRSHL
ncbi:collagenase-like [Pararge aegeria]|uniref:Jg12241 protein n=1 Tax=Pararge aegeria aegeria TaxID=348720 RepID=A0A8S4S6Y3_9NEOP|nr:collagenase-like [Pararge aegeria]CAH2247876.1 jg12241 [Pararge aegeria aegeria]